jgi:hypothetical protein
MEAQGSVTAQAITIVRQRTEMYIVISKPNRRSWYAGVVQVMKISLEED